MTLRAAHVAQIIIGAAIGAWLGWCAAQDPPPSIASIHGDNNTVAVIACTASTAQASVPVSDLLNDSANATPTRRSACCPEAFEAR